MDRTTTPMTAFILAAGYGSRMGHLTEKCPKPLLPLTDKTLIEHRIKALQQAGITNIIINLFYKGEQIQQYLQDGHHLGVDIIYSHEQDALDVGGGLIKACRLAPSSPMILTNADIDTDFDYSQLELKPHHKAHLVLTDNPHHNPHGDFHLSQSLISQQGEPKLTYTGIGVIDAHYFSQYEEKPLKFTQLLKPLIEQQAISGSYYSGYWLNVDTPERLQQAQTNHASI